MFIQGKLAQVSKEADDLRAGRTVPWGGRGCAAGSPVGWQGPHFPDGDGRLVVADSSPTHSFGFAELGLDGLWPNAELWAFSGTGW